MQHAMNDVLGIQNKNLAIPRRYDVVMKEIWAMQPRFTGRAGRKPFRLLEHPRFRAAYDFMLLRCKSGEVDEELGRWWDAFQHAHPRDREAMLLKDEPRTKRRRSRGRRMGAAANPTDVGNADTGDAVNFSNAVSGSSDNSSA